MNENQQIIFFDGVCIFCATTINVIANATKNSNIKFAYLQSDIARQLLKDYDINPAQLDTVIFYDDGKVYQKVDAVIYLAPYMDTKWSWLKILKLIPKPIANFIYDLVAKYRYNIFGKKNSCSINPKLKSRLL